MRARLIAGSAAAGWIRLVDQLRERALEALEIKVKVEDLVDADGLRGRHRLLGRFGRRIFDFLHRAARDCEHDDESHLALRTRHLEAKTLVLVAQYLDVAALQAAPADRAVVKARPIADELDDAHRSDPYYAPRLRGDEPSGGPRCTCIRIRRRSPNAWFRRAAPCGLPASIPGAGPRLRARR